MEEKKKIRSRSKGGRPPVDDPAVNFYAFKLNAEEKLAFEKMMEESGITDKSRFIKSVLFGKTLKVVKIDKATMDYYIRLTNFYHQFQAIGNNYNQTVKAIKTNFGEKRALSLLHKLERATFEMVILNRKIIELIKEYEQKYLQKRGG